MIYQDGKPIIIIVIVINFQMLIYAHYTACKCISMQYIFRTENMHDVVLLLW